MLRLTKPPIAATQHKEDEGEGNAATTTPLRFILFARHYDISVPMNLNEACPRWLKAVVPQLNLTVEIL